MNSDFSAQFGMKHRLMYVDMRMLSLLQDCLSGRSDPLETFSNQILVDAVDHYKKWDQGLFRNVSVLEVDNLFEKQLANLYRERILLAKPLPTLLSSKELIDLWKTIDFQLDQITCLLNAHGSVRDELISNWENTITQFQLKFSQKNQIPGPFSRRPALLSSIIRLFTDNPYTRQADFLVESQERATRSNSVSQISILSTPLKGPYLSISKGISASGLFLIDLYQWKWFGISQNMLLGITQKLMPETDTWVLVFHQLGQNETTALRCIPIIHKLFELTSFVGINALSTGISSQALLRLSITYGVGTCASWGAGKAVDLFYRLFSEHKKAPTYPLAHGLAKWVAFPLTTVYLAPFIFEQWHSLFTQPIALDSELCQTNKALCKQNACKVLGLSEKATLKEIQRAYRDLVRLYHPDHNPAGQEQFLKITLAKELCSLLN